MRALDGNTGGAISEKVAIEDDESRKLALMASAKSLLLCFAILCLPGFAKVENSVTTREQLSFDNMGRVLSSRQTTNGTAYDFSYQYTAAGGLAQETYPSGRVVRNCYDEAGRVSEVKQKTGAAGDETGQCTSNNGNILKQRGYGGAEWNYLYL